MTHFTSHTETHPNSNLSEFRAEDPTWLVGSTNQDDSDDENMVTCGNCGNCWDGNAQCTCYGIPLDDEPSPPNTPSHPMTLRSHAKNADETNEADEADTDEAKEVVKHPECWSERSHYGQCGQSCPCCRAEVGDTWGACLVCNIK
jgi:hypothetical protein